MAASFVACFRRPACPAVRSACRRQGSRKTGPALMELCRQAGPSTRSSSIRTGGDSSSEHARILFHSSPVPPLFGESAGTAPPGPQRVQWTHCSNPSLDPHVESPGLEQRIPEPGTMPFVCCVRYPPLPPLIQATKLPNLRFDYFPGARQR